MITSSRQPLKLRPFTLPPVLRSATVAAYFRPLLSAPSVVVGRTATDSPYWPGTVAVLEDDGPPELHHLLDDRTRTELRG